MHVTSRSYLTAGIAALGVGAIALSPIQPLPDQVALAPQKAVSNLAVELASTIDPITPWVDTITTSFSNIVALAKFYNQQPLPLLTTVAQNQVTYFQELTNGQGDLIPGQAWNNVTTFLLGASSPGDPAGEYISDAPITTPLGLSQQTIFALLPTLLGPDYETYKGIIEFTAAPASGELIGFLGPFISPLVQLTKSFTLVGEFFQQGDVIGAINELINIPANTTNASLNGAGNVDLTAFANTITTLPPQVSKVGINMGGLLTPGLPTADPAVESGGVMFDAVSAVVTQKVSNLPLPDGTSITVTDPGRPVGLIGSVVGLGQTLANEMVVVPPPVPTAAVTPAAAEAEVVEAAPVAAAVAAPAAAQKAVEAPAAEALAAVADNAPAADAPAAKAGSGAAKSGSATGGRHRRGD